MTILELKQVLLWCFGINYTVLIVWFGIFVYAHDWYYKLCARWFKVPIEKFDTVNFFAIVIYKLGVALFNLVPLLALHLVFK